MPKKIDINLHELERLAAEGLSRDEIATALNLNPATLQTKLAPGREERKAYDRGRAQRNGAAVFEVVTEG